MHTGNWMVELMLFLLSVLLARNCLFDNGIPEIIWNNFLKRFKYWVGDQWHQYYLIGRRCLFSLAWPPFWWLCRNKNTLWGRRHNKNTLWGSCFMKSISLAPHLFLLGWLKLNLIFLLDHLRLAYRYERWW